MAILLFRWDTNQTHTLYMVTIVWPRIGLNLSFNPQVAPRLTRRGVGADRTIRKNRFSSAGYEYFMQGECGLVDLESRVPANPQIFKFFFFENTGIL